MRKEQLMRVLASMTKVSQADTEAVFDALGPLVVELVGVGEKVRIPGLGMFFVRDRAEKRFVNPQTGEPGIAHARRIVAFRAEQKLRKGI